MQKKHSYTREELLQCGRGELFGPGNAQLPLPPMLMFDRISQIDSVGGAYDKGIIVAELDIDPSLWFFDCHFQGDPVMPGCLGLDAMWQLVGFYLGWMGGPGRGRALGVGEVKFTGQVLPENKKSDLPHQSQTGTDAQAGDGHRRRGIGVRRQSHLRSDGFAGWVVHNQRRFLRSIRLMRRVVITGWASFPASAITRTKWWSPCAKAVPAWRFPRNIGIWGSAAMSTAPSDSIWRT